MMFIADYVIVDYSTVLFEAALLNKPLYFYAFDEKEYINNRDFYINYHEEMPGVISDNSKVIMNAIKNNNYDLKKISNFSNKYVELERGKSTLNIVDFIKTLILRQKMRCYMAKFFKSLKKYFNYIIYATKAELNSEVSNSYL